MLSITDLSIAFHRNAEPITHKLNFTIGQGKIVGLVGESGSGKSVTAMSILRLLPKRQAHYLSGESRFRSKAFGEIDLLQAPLAQLRAIRGNEIAMVFQEPMTSLNPLFTCGEQVMEVLRLHKKLSHKEAYAKTLQLFEETQLPRPQALMRAFPHQISGGQKQRVMIAMAMACEPQLLIADEPTTALDVTVQKKILELLLELNRVKQTALLFISHDLAVVAELAHEVIVMYKGTIVETGTANEIFTQAKHPYTQSLLACRPKLNLRYKRLPTANEFFTRKPDGSFLANTEAYRPQIQTTQDRQTQLAQLNAQKPLLEARKLKTSFPLKKNFWGKTIHTLNAVDGVNLCVRKSETLGIVGESGCGKTTLGRSLLRLIEPDEGELLYTNEQDEIVNLMKLSQAQFRSYRKDLQIIFQDPYSSLNPKLTVGDALIEPMTVHKLKANAKERREYAVFLLEKVRLNGEHLKRYPHEFSGGQRQRICIARALALNPKLVICDESVSGQDVSLQALTLNLMADLKDEFQLAYIFISHDLNVVQSISDRIIVMKDGKIVEENEAQALYQNPQNDYTKELLSAIPKGV